jgi:hypothetical protein
MDFSWPGKHTEKTMIEWFTGEGVFFNGLQRLRWEESSLLE